jgi:hypothetical protein
LIDEVIIDQLLLKLVNSLFGLVSHLLEAQLNQTGHGNMVALAPG